MAEDVTLGEFAAVADLSPAHFSRAFKQATGRSPFQQLAALRLERAKALLADTRLPL